MFQAVVWSGSTERAIVRESPEFASESEAERWGKREIDSLRRQYRRRKHWRGKLLKDGLLHRFFGDHW